MAKLVTQFNWKFPSFEEVIQIGIDVESEMTGLPLNAVNAFKFTEEVKKRVGKLIVVEISD
ncbi:TPA: hypothetical protein PXR55_000232 [Yersinia enterocolitica]|nr:hypothetical protein [Yersinia enterocolitica]HDL8504964.1 hypothetical protein [Yersinia enterocolitica]